MLAALTSAAMPSIAVAGVRDSEQSNATDESYGIAQAVVQDAAGKLYDVLTCDTDKGRARLRSRVHAAQTLEFAKDPGGLGFGLDRVLAFEPGEDDQSVTGSNAVVVAVHHDGESRPLGLLTLDDCSSVGTAIGAIHRLRPGFLKENRYPVFTTGQIRAQLTSWIKRLQQAGHIPAEITGSWSRILETEGLWSFSTCPVHGGFSDGDFLFSGSAITAVTNWQDMQVNDPARDLAWVFSKLDEGHRNAVISAYGRMLGARLDDLIMLRANLWLQMEQVGEFIQALNAADNMKIMQFKAQVERLAHQLSDVTRHTARPSGVSSGIGRSASEQGPSTITVGTLLGESDRRGAAPRQNSLAGAGAAPTVADVPAGARPDAPENRASSSGSLPDDDATGESDRTGSSQIAQSFAPDPDSTADRPVQRARDGGDRPSSSATIALAMLDEESIASQDATGQTRIPHVAHQYVSVRNPHGQTPGMANPDATASASRERAADARDADPATVLIPLLEREERAIRDAQAGLDEYKAVHHVDRSGVIAPQDADQHDDDRDAAAPRRHDDAPGGDDTNETAPTTPSTPSTPSTPKA